MAEEEGHVKPSAPDAAQPVALPSPLRRLCAALFDLCPFAMADPRRSALATADLLGQYRDLTKFRLSSMVVASTMVRY